MGSVSADSEETQGLQNSSQKGQGPGSRDLGRDEEGSAPETPQEGRFRHLPVIACSADACLGAKPWFLHPCLFLRLWVVNHLLSGLTTQKEKLSNTPLSVFLLDPSAAAL